MNEKYFVHPDDNGNRSAFPGSLTKRELFAAMAMSGWRMSGATCDSTQTARLAVADADALLAALEPRP